MNQLLQEAFNRAAALPSEEQDRFARFLLAELEADQKGDQLFERPESDELLSGLAMETLPTTEPAPLLHWTRPTFSHAFFHARRLPRMPDGIVAMTV